MVLVKTLKIFHISILGKRGENNKFHYILKGKKVSVDNKNKKLKKVHKLNFAKADSP